MRIRDLTLIVLVGAGIGTGGLVAFVPAATASPAATLDVAFTTKEPGTGSGVRIKISYASPDGAKPSPVREAAIRFPDGAVLDGSALPACAASDAELMAQGRGACPPASQLGSGTLEAVSGVGPPVDPVMTDVTLFNAGDEVIELVQQKGTDSTLAIDRAKIAGNRYTSHPPATPGGPPDGETAVLSLDFTFDAPDSGGSAFFTTPPHCSGGAWTTAGTFRFDSATVESTSRAACLPTARRAHLRVTPSHVRRGVSTPLGFRIRGASPHCRDGAVIRMGTHRVRTNARGRAHLRRRLQRVGSHRVVARRHGCPTTRTRVIVTR